MKQDVVEKFRCASQANIQGSQLMACALRLVSKTVNLETCREEIIREVRDLLDGRLPRGPADVVELGFGDPHWVPALCAC